MIFKLLKNRSNNCVETDRMGALFQTISVGCKYISFE